MRFPRMLETVASRRPEHDGEDRRERGRGRGGSRGDSPADRPGDGAQPRAQSGGLQGGRARVVLAEDHAAVAAQLREILSEEFDVVASVADGDALIAAARALRPAVVVTDITMPGRDGLSAAAEVLRLGLAGRVVFVSAHGEAALVRRGLEIGGAGYVLKAAAGEELVTAVRAALRGERHVSPELEAGGDTN